MTRHRYPSRALLADYARAALGLAFTLPPLALVRLSTPVAAIFAGLAVLFAAFALATLRHQLGVIELDEDGIARGGPFPARIPWHALERVSLRWFGGRASAARPEVPRGFMQLVLKGDGRRVALDSRVEEFDAIARAAAAAAMRRGLDLGEATVANFAALGIRLEA